MGDRQPAEEPKGLQPDDVVLPQATTIRCMGGEIVIRPLPNRPFFELGLEIAQVTQHLAVDHEEVDLENLQGHIVTLATAGFKPVISLVCKLLGIDAEFLFDGMRPVETLRAIETALDLNDWPEMVDLVQRIRHKAKGSPLAAAP